MDNLSIEELDVLVESLTAHEHNQHAGPTIDHAITFLPLGLINDPEEMESLKAQSLEHQENFRSKMESLTLLKAKLIMEKTRIQATSLTKDTSV